MRCDAVLATIPTPDARCQLPALYMITNGKARVYSCSMEHHLGQLVAAGVHSGDNPVTITATRARRVVST